MVRNRQRPSGTLKTETECSEHRKLAVQLHLGEGLTIRETGERLGVSHCTVIRDECRHYFLIPKNASSAFVPSAFQILMTS
jgi:hypothetical protein